MFFERFTPVILPYFEYFENFLEPVFEAQCSLIGNSTTLTGYYGGETYYRWLMVTLVEECKNECLFDEVCDIVTYSEQQAEYRCLLYKDEDFVETAESYTYVWRKDDCPGMLL